MNNEQNRPQDHREPKRPEHKPGQPNHGQKDQKQGWSQNPSRKD